MANHAVPVLVREHLLAEAVRRHEVSAQAVPVIEDLLRHELSFEQALVGTGLIPADRFADWLTEASGLPLLVPKIEEQVLPPGLECETVLAWRVIPQKVAPKHWRIGLTDPWDQDIRSALEALAVEQGWRLDFVYVVPSVADRWLRTLDESRSSSYALARYARSLVERVEREQALTLVSAGAVVHPRQKAITVPAAWMPALHMRLARRSSESGVHVRHHKQHHRHANIELTRSRQAEAAVSDEAEHPVRDWTDAFQTFFEQGKLVFVLDEQGDVLKHWPETHVSQATEDWRAGKRWIASSETGEREELFHLTLAGYPGTVCLRSVSELKDWERAADQAHVEYAACIGQSTPHGMAWSIYSV